MAPESALVSGSGLFALVDIFANLHGARGEALVARTLEAPFDIRACPITAYV